MLGRLTSQESSRSSREPRKCRTAHHHPAIRAATHHQQATPHLLDTHLSLDIHPSLATPQQATPRQQATPQQAIPLSLDTDIPLLATPQLLMDIPLLATHLLMATQAATVVVTAATAP